MRDSRTVRRNLRDVTHPHRLDRGLPADAAGRGRVEMPFHESGIERGPRPEGNAAEIEPLLTVGVATIRNLLDVFSTYNDPFGNEKAGAEYEVVPRRPHADGQVQGPAAR